MDKRSTTIRQDTHRLTLAPMMKYTDRHFRYLLRLMSRDIVLYSEMVTSGALIYGDSARYLNFSPQEHPVALQVGGSDALAMQKVARIVDGYQYDEININVGCPSDRVQSGLIGACLMAHPDKVAECVYQMGQVSDTPITVKTRIGIDDNDSYEFLCTLVDAVKDAGCRTLIVHARKAWLNGLSPKENRDIPPLDYSRVYQLKKDYPELAIVINGGIKTLDDINHHLEKVDGVMIGRQLVDDPYCLVEWQKQLFDNDERKSIEASPSRLDIIDEYLDYIDANLSQGVMVKHTVRHLINMYKGEKGAKQWRQFITQHMISRDAQNSIQWLRDYINQYR